ncbi:hypothetical protein [Massilia aquatica]|uniref:Uncharacterized protein n=1 Tax=Massilia aquatica TaxID=2609000 RepID=A0ABX0MDB4_9BURK|nr:hypothetical protein [Massilia aquatica]NHZ41554.1 hypothetical protein [Massilia aquatica]
MAVSVAFMTDRFNLSVVGDNFINDCCFGEDVSYWLVSALCAEGIEARVVCMEDFGWVNRARFAGSSYLICVGGYALHEPSRPNYGQWRVVLERRRTLMQAIQGKSKMSEADPLVIKVKQFLMDAGFAQVDIEP